MFAKFNISLNITKPILLPLNIIINPAHTNDLLYTDNTVL